VDMGWQAVPVSLLVRMIYSHRSQPRCLREVAPRHLGSLPPIALRIATARELAIESRGSPRRISVRTKGRLEPAARW
jgi:hypothetical protein